MSEGKGITACQMKRALLPVRRKWHYCLSDEKGINACRKKRALLHVRRKGHYCMSEGKGITACQKKRVLLHVGRKILTDYQRERESLTFISDTINLTQSTYVVLT